ncbi:MAG: hypothetical protein WC641_03280 [Patescibacteria group bacterium]
MLPAWLSKNKNKFVLGGLTLVLALGTVIVAYPKKAEASLLQADPNAAIAARAQLCGYVTGAGTSPGATSIIGLMPECHYYEIYKAKVDMIQSTIQFGVVRALLGALQYGTQMIAQQTAQWILEGAHGKPSFWTMNWGEFLANVGEDAVNRFIGELDKTMQGWGLGSLCTPMSLNMRLALYIKPIVPQAFQGCDWAKMKGAFNQTKNTFSPTEIAANLRKSVQPGGNQIDMMLKVNSEILVNKEAAEKWYEKQRIETRGFKSITDLISGKIKTPAEVVDETVRQSNVVKLQHDVTTADINALAMAAFWAGFEQLPQVAASQFLNTLAVGALQKFFTWIFGGMTGGDETWYNLDLSDPFAQRSAQPKTDALQKAFSDMIIPDLFTNKDEDFVFEMTSCVEGSRSYWGCSMDEGLAQALRASAESGAYTVARAAGIGGTGASEYLHKDWELIPESEVKDNQDSGCYQRAYCASNLAKLRFARIIPLGWELAANSPFNVKANGRYVTLGQVVAGFNSCNAQGQVDAEHPWCHLINPAWVLTAPPFKCQLKGYGTTLAAPDTPMRQQECSDLVSCLKRDDKGKCLGQYGSCLSEKTVWRFGADSCDQKFVSCRTYQSRATGAHQGQNVSYIRNTIDYGSCNQDNVGCLYYATTRDVTTTSTERWVATTLEVKNKKGALAGYDIRQMPRVYFDATVQACDASSDGCTKVQRVNPGSPAFNLVRNGSFEDNLDNLPDKLVAWFDDNDNPVGQKPFNPATGPAYQSGQASYYNATTHQPVTLYPYRPYVLSFYARADGGAAPDVQVFLDLYQAPNKPVVTTGPAVYRSSNCSKKTQTSVGLSSFKPGNDWQRYTCEFSSNPDVRLGVLKISVKNAALDDVQLEEADRATDYIDGAADNLPVEHIKLPPEELGCKGDAKTDRKECADYALMCQATEAGCQGWSDAGDASGIEIPAIVSPLDRCPKSCVGYAEYRKLPSAFDLVNTGNPTDPQNDSADDTAASFVPSKAQACSADEAGCEELTNLEASAQGGESKLFLSYARACSKPGDDAKTFFTWEGSEETGYQLRTWSLVKELNAEGPKILLKAGPDGVLKDPQACTAATWSAKTDLDCRQFYDETGKDYYRYYSQTIISSVDCRDYRKNNSTSDDCTKTSGDPNNYNPTNKACIYHVLASLSNQCKETNAGCRGYLGTTGRNTATVLHETFAAATSSLFYAPNNQKIKISNEALLVGDHSLQIQASDASVDFTSATGSLYTVSFWLKTTKAGSAPASLKLGNTVVGTFSLVPDWKRFEVGPFKAVGTKSKLTWSGLPDPSYLDEVAVVRLQDVVYVKKDSWVIPPECDQTAEGIPQPRAMLGCREYKNRAGKVEDVRQFSRLCRYASIGCTAYVDTRNSDSPYAETFKLTGLNVPDPNNPASKLWDTLYAGDSVVTRLADRYVYAVDEPGVHCAADQASCRAFGKPTFDPTGAPSSTFETVYLKDDITQYMDAGGEPKALCRPKELFCDKFTSGQVTSYFRDPLNHVCEWQDKVALNKFPGLPDGEYSGWFVIGAAVPTPCYPEKISSGNTFLSEYSGTPNYRGWTDTCPVEQSECTEYRDSNDHTDLEHPQGKPYYFVDNNRLDKASCQGKVDLLSGCVLFRDMNDSRLTYSTDATYAKSHADGDVSVAPINCSTDADNPACQKVGYCVNQRFKIWSNTKQAYTGESSDMTQIQETKKHINDKCTTDKDCSVTASAVGPLADEYRITGTCQANDSNLLVKVKLDRDCQTWLGCASGETVYDPVQQKYKDLCTELATCDKAGGTGNQFCSHYVDRVSAPSGVGFQEKVMRQGAFVDSTLYASRSVGFGDPDYSSFSLPYHFQIADLQNRAVGFELLANHAGKVRNSYSDDFRLTAAVPLAFGGFNALDPYAADIIKDNLYPYLNLCRHRQTKAVGYYLADPGDTAIPRKPTEKVPRCYLAIDRPYTQVASDLQGSGVNPRNAQNLADVFEQSGNVKANQQLTQAFPNSECRSYPETNSPFDVRFVKDWNLDAEPPTPLNLVEGYAGVPTCEYGENCDCSYQKVNYANRSKYYAAYGASFPPGVCQGGDKDGQACRPNEGSGAVALTLAPTSTAGGSEIPDMNLCTGGGSCVPVQSYSLIRGIAGQCLQRDNARTLGGAKEYNPCLVWNPAPVLFGKDDIYHYYPTAGYLPPAESGEYYCVSDAREPRSFKTSVENNIMGWNWFDKDNPLVLIQKNLDTSIIAEPPGKMTAFWFDECFSMDPGGASDSDLPLGWSGMPGFTGSGNDDDFYERACGWGHASIDGTNARGTDSGASCAWVRTQNSGANMAADFTAGRWVTTGQGVSRNYAEYFVPINGKYWAKWLLQSKTDPGEVDIKNALLEKNFSYFDFKPLYKTGAGGGACSLSGWWADEFPLEGTAAGVDKGQNQLIKNIMAEWSKLTSQKSDFVRNQKGELIKLPCLYNDKNTQDESADDYCYYKFWQADFRGQGAKKFQMMDDDFGGAHKLSAPDVLYMESDGSKPFFSIRAMFEDASLTDNAIKEEDIKGNSGKLGGPFRFVGWWVTASFPGASNNRYIYMTLDIGHADICKEVARVRSSVNGDSVAFTDRVWDGSGFSLPLLGYLYGETNAPFGSARHTREIGMEPLFQVKDKKVAANFRMSVAKPTFISAGAKFFRLGELPKANWAWLSNLFAKIYNVYRYYDLPVDKSSYACVSGPQFGKRCSPDPLSSQSTCGWQGTCNPTLLQVDAGSAFCNSLSGVNAGQACGAGGGSGLGSYHVCHAAPLRNVGGQLAPQYAPCQVDSALWSTNNDHYTYTGTASSDPFNAVTVQHCIDAKSTNCINLTRATAAQAGAFKCANNAVHFPDGTRAWCRKPSGGNASTDCPIEVHGDCDGTAGHCAPGWRDGTYQAQTGGYEYVKCSNKDSDSACSFTWQNWWYNDMKRASGFPEKPMPYPDEHAIVAQVQHAEGAFFNVQVDPINGSYPINTNYPVNGWVPDPATAANIKIEGNLWWMGGDWGAWGQIGDTNGADPGKDIGSKNLAGARYLDRADWQGLNRFPGAFVFAVSGQYLSCNGPGDCGTKQWSEMYIPGHCEALPVDYHECANIKKHADAMGEVKDYNNDGKNECPNTPDIPNYSLVTAQQWGGGQITLTRWHGDSASKLGICEGGGNEGGFCTDSKDCKPLWVGGKETVESMEYCKSVSKTDGTPNSGAFGGTAWSCLADTGDPNSNNPDLDNNSCTHGAGYQKRPDVCGLDPNRADCLTGILERDTVSPPSYDQAQRTPPTDVTAGLFTPSYIAKFNNNNDTSLARNYSYMAYYAPRPPQIAAPDTSRQCPGPGQCPIAQVGAFSLDGTSEGKVAYVGGQALSTIRFYGWAADDQAGLKDLIVDWGDGHRQQYRDVQMKNKKPFCGSTRECEFTPGLSCTTDRDCPPSAGRCIEAGFCQSQPAQRCHQDADCTAPGAAAEDKCVTRLTFGNSDEDCEQNYFEFTHVYSCPQVNNLEACGATSRCSGDNDRPCAANNPCAPGDQCVAGLAKSGGCFDSQFSSCRFTPKVYLKDNWGWCAGECRNEIAGGKLSGGFGTTNKALLPNGGCYGGTDIYQNSDAKALRPVGTDAANKNVYDMCDPDKFVGQKTSYRPWVVFKGALQLGVGK